MIRTLLVWLLMLAIPAQGVAAATMVFCRPLHQGIGTAARAAQAATGGHVHDGRDATVAHAHAPADATAPAADVVGASAETHGASADLHKCNVCGSCCSTGALMGAVPTMPVADAAPTAFSLVVATVDPFASDGPDRPPRSLRV